MRRRLALAATFALLATHGSATARTISDRDDLCRYRPGTVGCRMEDAPRNRVQFERQLRAEIDEGPASWLCAGWKGCIEDEDTVIPRIVAESLELHEEYFGEEGEEPVEFTLLSAWPKTWDALCTKADKLNVEIGCEVDEPVPSERELRAALDGLLHTASWSDCHTDADGNELDQGLVTECVRWHAEKREQLIDRFVEEAPGYLADRREQAAERLDAGEDPGQTQDDEEYLADLTGSDPARDEQDEACGQLFGQGSGDADDCTEALVENEDVADHRVEQGQTLGQLAVDYREELTEDLDMDLWGEDGLVAALEEFNREYNLALMESRDGNWDPNRIYPTDTLFVPDAEWVEEWYRERTDQAAE